MTVEEFITNGAKAKQNNAYTSTQVTGKKSSRKKSATPFVVPEDRLDMSGFGNAVGRHLSEYSYDLTDINKPDNKYEEYGVRVNPVNTEEELQRERANNQAWLEQAGNSLVQAVGNEVALGTALGFSNMVDFFISLGQSNGEDDYTNPVSQWIEEQQDALRKKFEIYRKDPNATFDFGDFGWWADNAVSVASTASMLIPSTAAVKGLSLLGKITRAGKLTRGAVKAIHAAKAGVGLRKVEKGTNFINRVKAGWAAPSARMAQSINTGAEIGTAALLSRTMENYMEARGTYKESYDAALSEFESLDDKGKEKFFKNNPNLAGKSADEIARYIANNSADEVFRNDFLMLAFDIPQFKAINSLWKGMSKKAATAELNIANRNAAKSLLKNSEKQLEKTGFLANRKEAIKNALSHPLSSVAAIEWSEGIEEGYQGSMQARANETTNLYFHPEVPRRALDSYLTDASIWEQAFWGVVGGVAFQHIGSGLGNVYNKAKARIDKHKMSDVEYALKHQTEEKQRLAEINGRKQIMQDYVDAMTHINNGVSPDDFVKDPLTKQKVYENGTAKRRAITDEEAEDLRREYTDAFVAKLTLNATDLGNYELLRDFVGSEEFDKFFEEAGIRKDGQDAAISQRVLNQMDNVHEQYSEALNDVYSSADVTNSNIASLVARQIVGNKMQIDELSTSIGNTEAYINRQTENATNDKLYEDKVRLEYVNKALGKLDANLKELRQKRNDGKLSKAGFEQYEKEYNIRRKQLLDYAAAHSEFGSKDIKSNLKNVAKGKDVTVLLTKFDEFYNNFLRNNAGTTIKVTTPKADVADAIKKKIELEDSRSNLEALLPKDDTEFQEMYDEFSMTNDMVVRKKYDDAVDKINKYIESQDNLDKGVEDILTGNVSKELQDATDLLKLGHYSTAQFVMQINSMVEKARQERAAKAAQAQNTGRDGRRVSTEENERNTEEINQTAQNTGGNPDTANTSTGGGTGAAQNNNGNNGEEFNGVPDPIVQQVVDDTKALDEANDERLSKEKAELDGSVKEDARNILYSFYRDLFATDKEMFVEAVNQGVDSEEFTKIIELGIEELSKNNIPEGLRDVVTKESLKTLLNGFARRLRKEGGGIREKFQAAAIEVGLRINMDMAARTSTIADEEFASFIEDMFDSYISAMDVISSPDKATVINLKAFFKRLIEDNTISTELAYRILRNINDYVNNHDGSKYIFTEENIVNKYLNNPNEFFRELTDAGQVIENLDNYMHIARPSFKRDDSRRDLYDKAIGKLKNNSPVTFRFLENTKGEPASISVVFDGVEVGYLSLVDFDEKGKGFSRANKHGGLSADVYKVGDDYHSKLDNFLQGVFDINNKDYDDIRAALIRYQQEKIEELTGVKTGTNQNENADNIAFKKAFYNNPIIQSFIKDGTIVEEKASVRRAGPNGNPYYKYETINKTEQDRGTYILDQLYNIIFYNEMSVSWSDRKFDYEDYKAKTYKNFEDTYKIQQALYENHEITGTIKGLNNGRLLISDEEYDCNTREFTAEANPIVGVDQDKQAGAIMIAEDSPNQLSNTPGFRVGTMGFIVRGNNNAPMVAVVTSSNNVSASPDLAKGVSEEINSIIEDFQNGNLSFDEARDKFIDLFSGPGYGGDNLFSGYSVVVDKTNNRFALNIATRAHKENVANNEGISSYNLIFYRYKNGTTENGTGITYIPNGVEKKAKASKQFDKTTRKAIVDDIVSGLKFNQTFYAIRNQGVDNEHSHRYFYKENGEIIVKVGSFEGRYKNFSHFALSNNAFKTNQGLSNHSHFESSADAQGKGNSLYVDISVTSPVEGREEKEVPKTVKELMESTSKDNQGNTEELLEAAGFDRHEIDILTGRQGGIELVNPTYYYAANASGFDAAYSKRDKTIRFSPSGVNSSHANNFVLRRLLLHETLHKQFDTHKAFDKQYLANELIECYNELVRHLQEDVADEKDTSGRKAEAQELLNWLNENRFNPIDYFTNKKGKLRAEYAKKSPEELAQIFAEEFLVESLTQPKIANYLNKVDYHGLAIEVEEDNTKKTLWQKIIDILLKLFNVNNGNVEKNTILAREYQLLSGNEITTTEELLAPQKEAQQNEEAAEPEEANTGKDSESEQPTIADNEVIADDEDNGTIDEESVEEASPEDFDADDIADFNDDDSLSKTTTLDNNINSKTTTKEMRVDNYNNSTALNPSGFIEVADMDKFLDRFPDSIKPTLAKMMDEGNIEYLCR